MLETKMNPVIEKLLILQDRDQKILRLSTELTRLPIEKEDLDRQQKSVTEEAEKAKAESKRLELDRKKLEKDVEAKEALVSKYKTQLLEIKNNDQFHALQHEITNAEKEIRVIEDSELEFMEKFETQQATVKFAEGKQKDALQKIEMQRKNLDEKKSIVEKQLGEVKQERATLVADVDEGLLGRYERIFKSKNGQAVVRISHGLCMGCHLKLTTQEIHSAQLDTEMVTCTNCGRILYWTPE
jgi:predicted  nucleic acid-binding Zn-ribbon protein